MIVEFIGLPGSGKSTVGGACQPLLKAAGIKIQPIGRIAKKQASKLSEKNRFLRRYSGRNWLFGTLAFAQENPEVYDLIFQNSRHDFHANLWAMDFIAQLYFAQQTDTSDMLVFTDEGFFHRGVNFFSKAKSKAKLKSYLEKIPSCDVLVKFEIPPETALERCLARGNIPEIYKGRNNAKTLKTFERIQDLFTICEDHQINSGAHVLRIDTTASVETSSQEMCDRLVKIMQSK